MGCSDFTCDAAKARISDHAKDDLRCIKEATTEADDCDVQCCKDDPKTCRGWVDPAKEANNSHREMGCFLTDRWFKDAGEVQVYDADGKRMREPSGRLIKMILPKTTN